MENFEVIIIGGSYSGLSAGMALGRALRKVLIIDAGKPCNIQTPHSHNFITHDGKPPHEIAQEARRQVEKYDTVSFVNDFAESAKKHATGFEVYTASGKVFHARKLIFATGVKDIMPDIPGVAECWGISVIHCPYCHGYEVRNEKTGIFGNGEYGFEFSRLISNWTKDLTLFTNGPSTLTSEQRIKLDQHSIPVIEKEVAYFDHEKGQLRQLVFQDGSAMDVKAVYTKLPFVQHSEIPVALGCELTETGHIMTDTFLKTNVHGVFACGDNTTFMRTVSNAVAMGTFAGIMASKELIEEEF